MNRATKFTQVFSSSELVANSDACVFFSVLELRNWLNWMPWIINDSHAFATVTKSGDRVEWMGGTQGVAIVKGVYVIPEDKRIITVELNFSNEFFWFVFSVKKQSVSSTELSLNIISVSNKGKLDQTFFNCFLNYSLIYLKSFLEGEKLCYPIDDKGINVHGKIFYIGIRCLTDVHSFRRLVAAQISELRCSLKKRNIDYKNPIVIYNNRHLKCQKMDITIAFITNNTKKDLLPNEVSSFLESSFYREINYKGSIKFLYNLWWHLLIFKYKEALNKPSYEIYKNNNLLANTSEVDLMIPI